MKFWKALTGSGDVSSRRQSNSHKKRSSGGFSNGNVATSLVNNLGSVSTTPALTRRRLAYDQGNGDDPIYEDFCGSVTPSPASSVIGSGASGNNPYGTTFVELIKRRGTKVNDQLVRYS